MNMKCTVIPRLHDTEMNFRAGMKISLRHKNRSELAPVWLVPAWHFVVVSCKRIQSHKRELVWTRAGMKVAPVSCKHHLKQMVRKFPLFRSKRKKRSTSEGTPQFPNRISIIVAYHLTSNQNFWIFWPNGKHPICQKFCETHCNGFLICPSKWIFGVNFSDEVC